jgi:hypothetical protein
MKSEVYEIVDLDHLTGKITRKEKKITNRIFIYDELIFAENKKNDNDSEKPLSFLEFLESLESLYKYSEKSSFDWEDCDFLE